LHQAAKAGHEKCVQSLLNARADPECKISSENLEGNKTPVEIAQTSNFPNIVKIIKEWTPSPQRPDRKQKRIFTKLPSSSDTARGVKKKIVNEGLTQTNNPSSMDHMRAPRLRSNSHKDLLPENTLLSRRITELAKQLDEISKEIEQVQAQFTSKHEHILQIVSKMAPESIPNDKRTWVDIQSEIEEIHNQHGQLVYRLNEVQTRVRLLEWILVIFIIVYVFF